MILDKIRKIIVEDLEGDITIRGYHENFCIKVPDYGFRLKINHLAKPTRYILQDLFPDKFKPSEQERKNINYGKAVDFLIKTIWERLSQFYRSGILSLNLTEILREIKRRYGIENNDLEKIAKISFSALSLLFSFGFEPLEYSKIIRGQPSKIPLQYSGISPDIILKKNGYFIGDVKFGKYRKEYKNVITAYALAFEELRKEDVDYGILIHISWDFDLKIEIFKINDKLRSETIELIKEKYNEVYEALRNFNSP